jgi:hypothetical protein
MCPIEYYEIMRKSKDKNLPGKIAIFPPALLDELFAKKLDSMNIDFFLTRGVMMSIPFPTIFMK